MLGKEVTHALLGEDERLELAEEFMCLLSGRPMEVPGRAVVEDDFVPSVFIRHDKVTSEGYALEIPFLYEIVTHRAGYKQMSICGIAESMFKPWRFILSAQSLVTTGLTILRYE